MNPVSHHKKQLRTEVIQKREALPVEWVTKQSKKIQHHLKSIKGFNLAKIIHTYIAWKNEVQTQLIISELLEAGKRVVVPVIQKHSNQLKHSEIKNLLDLQTGAFGIMEPRRERMIEINISELDCVIVPGVAFDLSGHRLGYGGGYYDAFLKQTPALKIALGFEFQIVEKIPTRNEDEKVDILVTEKQVYNFR